MQITEIEPVVPFLIPDVYKRQFYIFRDSSGDYRLLAYSLDAEYGRGSFSLYRIDEMCIRDRRTTASSSSLTSSLTNTVLRFLIFGTVRYVSRYSSSAVSYTHLRLVPAGHPEHLHPYRCHFGER